MSAEAVIAQQALVVARAEKDLAAAANAAERAHLRHLITRSLAIAEGARICARH